MFNEEKSGGKEQLVDVQFHFYHFSCHLELYNQQKYYWCPQNAKEFLVHYLNVFFSNLAIGLFIIALHKVIALL